MKLSRSLFPVLALLLLCGTIHAETLQEAMAKAKALFSEGKFRAAADAYKDLMVAFKDELKSDNQMAADVWQAFGEALEKDGWRDHADKAFKRAADHRARLGAGQSGVQGGPEPSKAAMDKYRLESLKKPEAQEAYRRGAAFMEDRRPYFAILEFEKALEIEPDCVELMDIAGRAMADYGENFLDKAKNLMTTVRKSVTDKNMEFGQWLALGIASTRARKFDFKLAEEALRAALKLNPQDFLANFCLGDLFLVQGKYKESIEWFEKAQKLAAAEPKPLWGLGDAYSGLQEYQKGYDFYAQAYSLNPQSAEGAFKLAEGLKNLKRIDEAIHFYEVAISLDPTKAKYHLGLVAIYLPRIMDFSAKKHLDAALALEPENPMCHFYLGVFFEMRRRIDDAMREYERAVHYGGPEMLDAKFQTANIYAGHGNIFPGNNFSADNAGDKLEYTPYKDLPKAYRLYEEIVKINPKYPQAASITYRMQLMEETLEADQRLKEAVRQTGRSY